MPEFLNFLTETQLNQTQIYWLQVVVLVLVAALLITLIALAFYVDWYNVVKSDSESLRVENECITERYNERNSEILELVHENVMYQGKVSKLELLNEKHLATIKDAITNGYVFTDGNSRTNGEKPKNNKNLNGRVESEKPAIRRTAPAGKKGVRKSNGRSKNS